MNDAEGEQECEHDPAVLDVSLAGPRHYTHNQTKINL